MQSQEQLTPSLNPIPVQMLPYAYNATTNKPLSSRVKGIAISNIVLGVGLMIMQCCWIPLYGGYLSYVASGIWGGILILTAGALALVPSKRKETFALAVTAAVCSGIIFGLVLSTLVILFISYYYYYLGGYTALLVIMMAFSIVTFALSIVLALEMKKPAPALVPTHPGQLVTAGLDSPYVAVQTPTGLQTYQVVQVAHQPVQQNA